MAGFHFSEDALARIARRASWSPRAAIAELQVTDHIGAVLNARPVEAFIAADRDTVALITRLAESSPYRSFAELVRQVALEQEEPQVERLFNELMGLAAQMAADPSTVRELRKSMADRAAAREEFVDFLNTVTANLLTAGGAAATAVVAFAAAADGGTSETLEGLAALRLLASTLLETNAGELFLGGDAGAEEGGVVEDALALLASTLGMVIEFGESRSGSWWRAWRARLAELLTDDDLATLKRAAEVQVLDRFEGASARDYSEALSALAAALGGVTHGYLVAKNAVVLKTLDANGEPLLVGRVLTSEEVLAYERGDLAPLLRDPVQSVAFIRGGQRPRLASAQEIPPATDGA